MLYRITRHTALTSAHRPRLIESTHTTTILTRRDIEMFYNPKRRHSSAMQLSPVEFEKRYFQSLESV